MRMLNSNLRGLSLLLLTSWLYGQAAPSIPGQPQLPTISSAPGAQIVPPPPGYRFPDGQSYVYAVEWHLFTAGTAVVSLKSEGNEQHVIATANSAGVVNTLYKVNDHFEGFFDSRKFCSLRISKHIEEGSHARQTEVHFDYTRGKSVLDEKNLKTNEPKHVENDIPPCVTDVISGFYYVASLPLQVGNTYVFIVNDGGKTTEVAAHVEAREQVKVPAGAYQTVRVRAEATSGGMKGRGTVWSWFTDDGVHTPVQMRCKLGWGTLLFRLQRIDKQ